MARFLCEYFDKCAHHDDFLSKPHASLCGASTFQSNNRSCYTCLIHRKSHPSHSSHVTLQMEFLFTFLCIGNKIFMELSSCCVSNKRKFSSEFFRHFLMRAKNKRRQNTWKYFYDFIVPWFYVFRVFSLERSTHRISNYQKKSIIVLLAANHAIVNRQWGAFSFTKSYLGNETFLRKECAWNSQGSDRFLI